VLSNKLWLSQAAINVTEPGFWKAKLKSLARLDLIVISFGYAAKSCKVETSIDEIVWVNAIDWTSCTPENFENLSSKHNLFNPRKGVKTLRFD